MGISFSELHLFFHGTTVVTNVILTNTPGVKIRIDTDSGGIEMDGERFETEPVPPFMADMISSGGLIPWAREKLAGN